MTLTFEATYQNGILKPKKRLRLPEGATVRLTIATVDEEDDPLAGLIGICKTGRTDGAANHDKYLYGRRP